MAIHTEHEAKPATASEALRLFIAITPPPPVILEAERIVAGLRPLGDVRWVTSERLHLTLKFLGSVDEEKVPRLQEGLAQISNNCLRFVITLERIGAFPSARRPQTLWHGIGGDMAALAQLVEHCEALTEPLGFARENRPFRPHLTLGRVRSPRGLRELATELEERAHESPAGIPWPIDSIALFRSELKPNGPLYTELFRFPLAPAGSTPRE